MDPDLEGYTLIWRTILWDGAPEPLIAALARHRCGGPINLTPDLISQLAVEGAVTTIEDAIELGRLGVNALRHQKIVARVREASRLGLPRVLITAEPGLVKIRLRRDLRALEWFAINPHAAGELSAEILEAAREALAGMGEHQES